MVCREGGREREREREGGREGGREGERERGSDHVAGEKCRLALGRVISQHAVAVLEALKTTFQVKCAGRESRCTPKAHASSLAETGNQICECTIAAVMTQ